MNHHRSRMSNATAIAALPCPGTLPVNQLESCCVGNGTTSGGVFAATANVTGCVTNLTSSFSSCVDALSNSSICICIFTDVKPETSLGYTGKCGNSGNVCNSEAEFTCNGTEPNFTGYRSGAVKLLYFGRGGWITCAVFALLLFQL